MVSGCWPFHFHQIAALKHGVVFQRLAVVLLVALLVIAVVPALSKIFDLRQPSVPDLLAVAAAAAAWVFLVRYVWKRRLLERFLGTDPAR